ncbi:class I SAM-dependent methyltransferase [Flavobacterium difficile]|uniref:Class I SAM-dependent methyltransferase n=1 Tax=Flavobacterium difficile TaxID=2709659 RepID=A0ABX0HZX8_9FLAO|nr:class I SAM-dependent methyltransferase [Flavobacterium difficile]NHM00504.1 class I SAM-dependent methyltransferase [Flavobacterium difficile]
MFKKWWSKSVQKIKQDDFISRLRCSVIGEGMLHEGNIFLLDYAIQNMPNEGIVLEIGCYGGLSTNLIIHLLKKHKKGNPFMGCDAWVYEGYHDHLGNKDTYIDGRIDISRTAYTQYIKNAFITSTLFLHAKNLPHTCHLTSDLFFDKWQHNEVFTDVFDRDFKINERIAFAYIDGDHSYEQTKKDFENVASRLMVNGYVLIDDSAKNMTFGSAKFIKEIQKNKDFKLIDSNPNFLFQKIN